MYKYKYKYKYGFMGPEIRDNQRLTSERNGLIFQSTPPPIEGEPNTKFSPSIFYTEKDQKGDSFELWPGQRVSDLGGEWSKKIASIYVRTKNLVILSDDIDFKGARLVLVGLSDKIAEKEEGTIWNLDKYYWENRASSIQVIEA
jgi:hypothetical protein